jgi:hypothetical protein
MFPTLSSFLSSIPPLSPIVPPLSLIVSTDTLAELVTETIGNIAGSGGIEVQPILYSLRQTMYSLILNQGNLFKEFLDGFRNMTLTELIYYLAFLSTTYWCWKDLSYKKSIQKIKETHAISPNMVKRIEMFLFIVVMILFQDVDNATG